MNLPERIEQHIAESESYAILLYKLRKLGIFRSLTENDYGIDFEIEIVDKGEVTGKIVKAQVKSAKTIYIREGDKVPTVGGIKESTLYYWAELSSRINVIAFAVDLTTENIYLTRPIYWQAVGLINGDDKTKTIEFLPIHEHHDILSTFMAKTYAYAPTAAEELFLHESAIRHLKPFLELYNGVFHYDDGVEIFDPDIFGLFLEMCSDMVWRIKDDVRKQFDEKDRKNCFYVRHWANKSGCDELHNHICREPMRILMPVFLKEMKNHYDRVMKARYYFRNRNPRHLRIVYKNPIPDDLTHDKLCNMMYDFESTKLSDSDFDLFVAKIDGETRKMK